VLVWLNGRFLPARDARVSALDRGLLHGDGVYDTWRTYGGVPFATAAHLRRLAAAARALGLPAPGAVSVWERRVHRLVARCGLADAAVRLTVTRGTAGEGLVPEGRARPTLLLTARRLPTHLGPRQAHGVPVVLLPFPRDAGPPWGGLKLVGHPSAVVGRVTASRRGAAEGLYLTAGGEITEATSANLFLVERGVLVTPPREAGILPGVTRALVTALARRAGFRVVYVDRAAILHKGGSSADLGNKQVFSYGYFIGRNAFVFARKYGNAFQKTKLFVNVWIGILGRIAFFTLNNVKSAVMGQRAFVRGMLDGMRGTLTPDEILVKQGGIRLRNLSQGKVARFVRWLGV